MDAHRGDGYTALMRVSGNGDTDVMDLLLEAGGYAIELTETETQKNVLCATYHP